MLASIASATLLGVEGRPVRVEVHVSAGLPGFTIVGLPDAAVREARDRVRAAILSSGLGWRQARTTVNLAPSGIRKAGAALDLPMAVGYLVADEGVPRPAVEGIAFLGELGLDGSIRPVVGILPLVDAIDADVVVVPPANVAEARLVGRHQVRCASNLQELVGALTTGEWPDPPHSAPCATPPPVPDLASVRGHAMARWALEVAAAGGHHLLLVGPPGAGKTMLATRLPGLLPTLAPDVAMEVTRVHSAAGRLRPGAGLITTPPFRAPHHTATQVALIGGGTMALRPGEVSLAHGGVLFLDELGEFPTSALDALRQPLEEGVVRVARAHASVTHPARFILVAASNPCPCGTGAGQVGCRCTDAAVARYARRLSGPLLDRIDIRLWIAPPTPGELLDTAEAEPSEPVRRRVVAARDRAVRRGVGANSAIQPEALDDLAPLTPAARRLVEAAMAAGRLSARGLRRVRTLALTIDDLREGDGRIDDLLLTEAMALRSSVSLGWASHSREMSGLAVGSGQR